jgi:hypothetical protein
MWLRLLTLSVFLSNCCLTSPSRKSETVPLDFTYCQLAKDPSAFSGKQIRIRVIYSYMFEVSRLKSPTCCAERDALIWVSSSSLVRLKLARSTDSLVNEFG